MVGSKNDPGLIQRAAFELLWFKRENQVQTKISIWASYYEIVGQKINDLLVEESVDLRIAEKPSGAIKGLKVVKIETMGDVKQILAMGNSLSEMRSSLYLDQAAHHKNRIMRFEIKIEDKAEEEANLSVLHFIELQTSGMLPLPSSYLEEPEPKSGMSSPIYVVNMLNMCNDHRLTRSILFKNNALNHLLKVMCGRGDIINGASNSYTSIICNISPLRNEIDVSTRTLKFATEAAKVKIKPNTNYVSKDYEPETDSFVVPYVQKGRLLNKLKLEQQFRTTDPADFNNSRSR